MKKNNNEKVKPQQRKYEIPIKGSLGILAAGYKGILAWRKAMAKANKSEKS